MNNTNNVIFRKDWVWDWQYNWGIFFKDKKLIDFMEMVEKNWKEIVWIVIEDWLIEFVVRQNKDTEKDN